MTPPPSSSSMLIILLAGVAVISTITTTDSQPIDPKMICCNDYCPRTYRECTMFCKDPVTRVPCDCLPSFKRCLLDCGCYPPPPPGTSATTATRSPTPVDLLNGSPEPPGLTCCDRCVESTSGCFMQCGPDKLITCDSCESYVKKCKLDCGSCNHGLLRASTA